MKLIAVLGMHRSGTSAFTGLLSELGVDLGPEDGLLPPAADNPIGFFENEELYQINLHLLEKFGGHWTSPPLFPPGWESEDLIEEERRRASLLLAQLAERTDGWLAIKDPRLCLLVPFWESLHPVDRAFHVARHPLSVAASLEQRNGMAIDTGVLLWIRYVSSAYRHHPEAVIIDYDELVESTPDIKRRVAAMLGESLTATVYEDGVVRADLRHSLGAGTLDSDLGHLALRIYDELTSGAEVSTETQELLRVLGDPAMGLVTASGIESLRGELQKHTETAQAKLTKAQTRLESLKEKYRVETAKTNELKKRLDEARTELQSAKSSFKLLRGRRSVRLALKGASLFSPLIHPVKAMRLWTAQRRRRAGELTPDEIAARNDGSGFGRAGNDGPWNVGIVFTRGPDHSPQSSAFIRLLNPLTDDAVVDRVTVNEIDFQNPAQTDVTIVQRTSIPTLADVEGFLSKHKRGSTPLIVDIDDAFLLIDDGHPEFDAYKGRNAALEFLLEEADQAWFATQPLAELYSHVAPDDVRIMENTLDPRLWREHRQPDPVRGHETPVRLLYMGTATHDDDFVLVRDALSELADDFDFTLTLVGAVRNPPDDLPWLDVAERPRGANVYPRFVHWLRSLPPFDVGVSPLVPSKFNDAKSDIKFLDYSALGVISVLSEGPAYQGVIDKGLAVGADPERWVDVLGSVLADIDGHKRMAAAAESYLWSERSSTHAAQRMADTFNDLKQRM